MPKARMTTGQRLAIFAAMAAAAFLAACGDTDQAPGGPPQTQAAPAPPPPIAVPPPPDDLPLATEMPVYRVESVMVSRLEDAPESVLIQAAGAVYSAGWSNARLVPVETDIGNSQFLSFRLLATSPAAPQEALPPYSVEARLQLDAVSSEVTSIRILSATNELLAVVGRP